MMTSAFVQELLQSKEVFTADPARVLQGLVPINHHLGLGSRLVQTHCLGLFQVLSLACLGLGLGLGLGLSQILGLGLESMAFWSSSCSLCWHPFLGLFQGFQMADQVAWGAGVCLLQGTPLFVGPLGLSHSPTASLFCSWGPWGPLALPLSFPKQWQHRLFQTFGGSREKLFQTFPPEENAFPNLEGLFQDH